MRIERQAEKHPTFFFFVFFFYLVRLKKNNKTAGLSCCLRLTPPGLWWTTPISVGDMQHMATFWHSSTAQVPAGHSGVSGRCLHNRWSAPGPLPGFFTLRRLFTLRREEWCKSHLSHLWLLLQSDELKVSVTARTSAMLRNLVFFSSLVCNYYQLHYTYFHGEKYPLILEDSVLYFGLNWVIFQQNTEKSCLGELENNNKSLLFFLA